MSTVLVQAYLAGRYRSRPTSVVRIGWSDSGLFGSYGGGIGYVGHQGVGRYPAEAAGLEVLDGLADLGPGVHHKRAVVFDMVRRSAHRRGSGFRGSELRVLVFLARTLEPVAGAEGD